jgi:hypothetical protein
MHLLKPEQYGLGRWRCSSRWRASMPAWRRCWRILPSGEVWVDDLNQPQVGYASSPESQYLAGDAGCTAAYAGLRQVIPSDAYVITSPGWDAVLEQVWQNRFARRHARCHLLLAEPKFPQWRDHLPAACIWRRSPPTCLSES